MNSIDNIKKYYSIIEIAKRLGLEIDKNNKALCPFHNDNNPSLSFNIEENYYHCFSCGAGGDNIKLVKEILHCSFQEAVEFITNSKYQYRNNETKIKNVEKKDSYSDIYKSFLQLLNNDEAISYLVKRKITQKQILENNIKNIPKNKKDQLNIIYKLLKLHSKASLIQSGIISRNKENNNLYLFHYKHRLIIPYFDIDGNNINSIQGRSIDEDIKPKYLFNKNAKDSIYNINKLGNIKDIILCEGAIDALSLERFGFCAIALSGITKSNLLQEYPILKKYNIYSFSDNDNAGKKLIKDIYKLDNYKGAFLIDKFTNDKNIKDINELLVQTKLKSFKIDLKEYYYFEIPNNKICILDYYIFTENELEYIKNKKDFNKALYSMTIDKKTLTYIEYKNKYGELN